MFTKTIRRLFLCVLALLLAAPLTGFMRLNPYVERCAAPADVRGHWAERNILYAICNGLVNVFTDGQFRPDEPMTQAGFENYGLTTDNPEGFISRQDAAVVFVEFFDFTGNPQAAAVYTDAESISPHALSAVGVLTDIGVVMGFADGSFRPKEYITRAEFYSALSHIDNLLHYSYPAPGFFEEPAENPIFPRASNITEDGFDLIFTVNSAALTEDTYLLIGITADASRVVNNDNFLGLPWRTWEAVPVSEMEVLDEFLVFSTLSRRIDVPVSYVLYVYAALSREDVTGSVRRAIVTPGGPAVASVAAAADYTLVLLENGELFVFDAQSGPVPVMDNVSAVFTDGAGLSFAIDNDGTLFARERQQPLVPVMENVRDVITADCMTYIITADNSLYEWDNSATGHLRGGGRNQPEFIMDDVVSVSAGFFGAVYAVTADNRLFGWGHAGFGQLMGYWQGQGRYDKCVSSPIHLLDGVADVFAGENAVYFITTEGTLYGFGMNNNGSLGVGYDRAEIYTSPQRIMENVRTVTVQSGHVFAITTMGELYGFGSGSLGNLGLGDAGNVYYPAKIMTCVEALVSGDNHTLVLDTGGSVWGFGRGYSGQLGIGTFKSVLYPMRIYSNAKAVFAAGDRSYAASQSGGLLMWGGDDSGSCLEISADGIPPHPAAVNLQ